jgi:peptide/nickel transport system permease protein
MIPVLFGVILVVFSISFFTPGDPVMAMLGNNYSEELYVIKAAEYGLDQPFWTQFFNYVVNIVTKFDFGKSYSTGLSVGSELAWRLGTTLKLGIGSTLMAIILGLLFGLLSAVKQYSIWDYLVTIFAMFFAAMPNFWLALMSQLLFALKLGWLPATGFDSWKSYVLPTLCGGLSGLAVLTRMTRSSMLEVIRQDYIRTARAKGLKEGVIIRRHALKNALIPVVTVIGMQLGMIMGGSVIIETIFSIPGIGLFMLNGINNRDYPVINGTTLLISTTVCVMNLIVDVAYAFIDPRIKAQYTSGKKKKKNEQTPAAPSAPAAKEA